VLLSGCVDPLEVGRVADKEYEQERFWVDRVSHTYKVGDVRFTTYSYDLRVDEEDWILVIEGWNKDEKFVRETHYVSKGVFDSFELGDRYEVGPTPVYSDGSAYVRPATEEDREIYPTH